ncbi:MAG: glycosyltransferase family 2 protein [Nitrososphaeria archaeon]
MDDPRVSIVILNWNRWKDTIECLESVYKIDYSNYDVIIIDNGSRDHSIENIKDYAGGKIRIDSKFFKYCVDNKPIIVFEVYDKMESFPKELYEKLSIASRLIIFANKKNYGFAGGSNIGIKFALHVLNPEYILLLNNDVVVDKGLLKELVKVAESDSRIGIVGPKIYYYDYEGRSDVISFIGEDIISWKGIGRRYGCGEVDRGQWDKPMEPDKIEGSCMLIRGEVFKKVGFFDERYFCYYEETDLCMRAKKAGFKLMYCPTAKVWHKIGSSAGGHLSPIRTYYATRNRILFIKKFFPHELWKHTLYVVFNELPFTLIRCLFRKNLEALRHYLIGLMDGYEAAFRY